MPFPVPGGKPPLKKPTTFTPPGVLKPRKPLPNLPAATAERASASAPPSGKKHEVPIYDSLTPGRAKLEEVCHRYGLFWGLVRVSTVSKGNNEPPTTRTACIVGRLYENETTGGDGAEECLMALAQTIEQEHE